MFSWSETLGKQKNCYIFVKFCLSFFFSFFTDKMSVRISYLLIVDCCLFGLAMASLEAEDRAITWSPKIQAILDAMKKGRTTPKPAPIINTTPRPPPPYAQFVPDPTKNPYCNITTCGRHQGNHTVCLNPV